MQIMPGGAAWTNPAALSQQASGDPKQTAAQKSAASTQDPVTPLEETGKTTDRDANERYDGPQHQTGQANSASPESAFESESLLSLPASSDQDVVTLDLLG